jgi:monovalent cation:H+ antiporter, CPA1 family
MLAGMADPTNLFILVFMAAALIALIASRIGLSLTPTLLTLGLVVGAVPGVPTLHLSARVILFVFLPPLLFEAAFNLDLPLLWSTRRGVLVLALPGVLLATGVAGLLVRVATPLPWSEALLFGAIISATDPVAVLAAFRSLNADRRLSVLLEGESLLNDGIALVLVAALVDAVGGDVRPARIVGLFGFTLVGGILVGATVGAVGHRLIALATDHLTEMSLSLALAYGAFLIGDELGVSPVFATLSAAVTLGQLERARGDAFSTEFARLLDDLWGLLAFMANAALFVLMGMEMRVGVLWRHRSAVVVAVAAALIGRAVVAYGLNRFGFPLTRPERHVIFWGGLSGAVAVAAALSLTPGVPDQERLQAMTFGVVIFTVLAQGLTIGPLVRRLDLLRAG